MGESYHASRFDTAWTQSGADVGELKVRLTSLSAEIARLNAEASGADTLTFPAGLEEEQPRIVQQSKALFENRKKSLKSRTDSQNEAVNQRRQEIQEINARMRNQADNLKLMKEQIAISDELLKEDLTNRYNHLDLLKEESRLKGQIDQDRSTLRRAQSALKEAQAQLEGIDNAYREEAGRDLESTRREFQEMSQRVNKYKDSLERTVLRSPVDGVVKTLYVATVGGVLKPGQTAIDIVPGGDRLVIEAKLPTQDIGYVRPGQAVTVKLASADAMRFGNLMGTVTNISPDTLVTQDGQPFYKVRIETENDRFQHGDLQYRLFPGMQVQTGILTGERTVLEYLAGPFLNSINGAMGER